MPCTACLPGSFKNYTGPGSCVQCSSDTYSSQAGASACTACFQNAHSLPGSSSVASCTCKAGYQNSNLSCTLCLPGSFSVDGNEGCKACPINHYYPEMMLPYDADRCLPCPTHSTAPIHSYRLSSCQCLPGFTHTETASSFECSLCAAGSFCPNIQHSDGSRALLTTSLECPPNSWSSPGATSVQDCFCMPGYYGSAGDCEVCDANHYCPENATSMISCPSHSNTLGVGGQATADACVCDGGYYVDEATLACEVCPLDSYCYSNIAVSCPADSTAVDGSDAVEDCKCHTGLYMDTDPNTGLPVCLACPANVLCVGGSAMPTNCANAAVVSGLSCVCPPGAQCVGEQNTTCVEPSTCQTCGPDTYCANNALQTCPQHATAPANSSAFSACVCRDGYYMEHDACHLCPIDSYCAHNIQHTCHAWDPNLVTQSTGKYSFEDCRCRAGYFRMSTADLCKPCPLDFYCPDGEELAFPSVVQCLENEYTYDQGSTSRLECICDTGHKLDATGAVTACLPCGQGERCQAGEVIEYQCHFQLRTANEDHSKCVCLPGFQQTSELTCEPCPPGSVKPLAGDHQCVLCAANEFSYNTTLCKDCAQNHISPPGSAECTCAAPYVPGSDIDASLCELCGVDHYYVAGASQYIEGVCEPCMHNSSTEGKAGQIGRASCICDSGFVRSTQHTCTPCPVNTFEEDGVCRPCGVGATSPEASAAQAACQCNATACALKMPWHDCANECPSVVESCTLCPPGSFRAGLSDIGNNDACELCALDRYQNIAGQDSCNFCPLTRQTLDTGSIAASNCTCRAGHEPSADPSPLANCSACAAGHYKTDPGDVNCLVCPVGTFMPYEGATACLHCDAAPAGTPLSFTVIGQTADPKLQVDKEVIITVGQQVIVDWTATAPMHPFGVSVSQQDPFTPPADDVVTQDIDHASMKTTITVHSLDTPLYYTCALSHGFIGVPITILPATAYSEHTPGANTTLAVASTAASDCVCDPGHFRGDSLTCEACIVGSFKTLPGMQACDFCGSNVTSYDLHLIHHYGSGPPGATDVSHCVSCPGDGHSAGRPYTDVSYDSPMNEPEDCLCFPGYDTFSVASGCEACTNFTRRSTYSHDDCEFCPPKHYFFAANEPCVLCQLTDHEQSEPVHSEVANSHYASLPWATSEADCTCRIGAERVALSCVPCAHGFFRDSLFQTECLPCPKNHYTDETRSSVCQACPAHSFTLDTGSTLRTDCLCEAGFEWDGTNCVACAAGFFKAASDVDPDNRDSLSQQCQPCASGFYSDQLNSTECSSCPPNQVSETPRDSPEACVCDGGYGGEDCAPCPTGTYNPGNVIKGGREENQQHAECMQCPVGKTTAEDTDTLRYDAGTCFCVPGTGTHDASPLATCTACQHAYYSPGGSNIPCFHCGFGTISFPETGATSIDACECNHELGLREVD